jgi:hypothetical protein
MHRSFKIRSDHHYTTQPIALETIEVIDVETRALRSYIQDAITALECKARNNGMTMYGGVCESKYNDTVAQIDKRCTRGARPAGVDSEMVRHRYPFSSCRPNAKWVFDPTLLRRIFTMVKGVSSVTRTTYM